jgi:glycosyltransferase 2 family protein
MPQIRTDAHVVQPLVADTRQRLLVARLLSFAVSALILICVLSMISRGDWQSLRVTDWPMLVVAGACALPIAFTKVVKWWLLLRTLDESVSLAATARSFLGGIAVAIITPARLGEAARIAYLPSRTRAQALGVLVIDRLIDVLVLAVATCATIPVLLHMPQFDETFIVLAAILVLMAAVGLMLAKPLARPLANCAARVPVLGSLLVRVSGGLSAVPRSALLVNAVIAMVSLVFGAIQFDALIRALSPSASITAAPLHLGLIVFPPVVLSNLVPLSIGGLGVRESTAAWLLGQFGIPAVVAVSAAFLLFVFNMIVPGLIGVAVTVLPSNARRSRP